MDEYWNVCVEMRLWILNLLYELINIRMLVLAYMVVDEGYMIWMDEYCAPYAGV